MNYGKVEYLENFSFFYDKSIFKKPHFVKHKNENYKIQDTYDVSKRINNKTNASLKYNLPTHKTQKMFKRSR